MERVVWKTMPSDKSQSRQHELRRILAINRHYDESPRTAVNKENGCGRYPEV
jgi:hypothetical protein